MNASPEGVRTVKQRRIASGFVPPRSWLSRELGPVSRSERLGSATRRVGRPETGPEGARRHLTCARYGDGHGHADRL